jgi:cobalt-zinc-cadmium resistance protein CzcA
MDVGREQYLVRGLGLLSSVEDIGGIVLKAEDGVPVYLRDVADVPSPRTALWRSHPRWRGSRAGHGPGAHRRERQGRGRGGQDQARHGAERLARGHGVKPIYERTDLVNKAVGTATRALIEGSLLVAVVLFLFLGELRSALVVIVTLPLAMLIAFIGMGSSACRPT